MRRFLQAAALTTYRLAYEAGAFRLPGVRRVFELGYDFYKTKLEASEVNELRRFVSPNSIVLDVGANIGFFTLRFAQWVSNGGKVVALEPERHNFERLTAAVQRAGCTTAVDLVQGVAADLDGTLHLVLNPHHPADHRLGPEGEPVAAYTLDRLMADRGWPPVSLIKIDVQGAEVRVIRGARELLRRWKPVLYLEIDDRALVEAGFSADELIDELAAFGYRMYQLSGSSAAPIDRAAAAKQRAQLGYGDFLFLHSSYHLG
jgi:FkbM family methyltransferase